MNRQTYTKLAGYLLLIIIYFTLRATGLLASCEWFMVLPTLFASAAAFTHGRKGGWLIPLALLFSAAGDYGGAIDAFIPQVSCFAVAHIFYICDFIPRCRLSVGKLLGAVLYSLPLIAYLIFVVMRTGSSAEAVAISIYGAIILTMGLSTLFQERNYKWLYLLAATIFVLSDAVIVYIRVVDSLPYAGTIIMATYYAAQGIFLTLHSLRNGKQD